MNLDGVWHLSCAAKHIFSLPIQIPGDVHTALLNAGKIPNPYWALNEELVQWVPFVEWTISKTFQISRLSLFSAFILVLEMVDTFATVKVNDHFVLNTTNHFRFYRPDIKRFLIEGTNTIEFIFHPAPEIANQTYEKLLPAKYPWSEGNNKVPNMNLLRKPQFQSGWDWGPCIIPTGIYKSVKIIPVKEFDLQEVAVHQTWTGDQCKLEVEVELQCYKEIEGLRNITLKFHTHPEHLILIMNPKPGKLVYKTSIEVSNVKLWTIHEFGEQPLYELNATIDDQTITKKIGIRDLVVETNKDEYGTTFQFRLNGKIVNVKGSNMIPMDSFPSRMTRERCYELLSDMKESNMNLVRIWGGGYYPDMVYEIADELGLLVWQDMMFACAQYPTAQWFLDEVSEEFKCQVNRNKHHASIAIWCGDNEDFLAINWFGFEEEYKQWLKDEYAVFNTFCKEQMEKLDPSRRFWPASPSDGTFDYKGNWTYQTAGDMHYWEVWHGGQPFESFYTIKPRFCSEFGYQSWPSMPTVKTFCPEDQFNIESDSFSNHQKNAAGNKYIQNMFAHYFVEPKDFETQLYLSQVQQSFAIRMGCEYWRTLKPWTRGIIYWQINDCWPVSSWSSIEYQGRWKQLQYHAKRFFAPLLVTFFENQDERKLYVRVVNDRLVDAHVSGTLKFMDYNGDVLREWEIEGFSAPSDSAEAPWVLDETEYAERRREGFFYAELTDSVSGTQFDNWWMPCTFKDADIQVPTITYRVSPDGKSIVVHSSKPAFFVTLESEKVRKFSDNSFLLLRDVEKTVTCPEAITWDDLKVYRLKGKNDE